MSGAGLNRQNDEALRKNRQVIELPDSMMFMAAVMKILGMDLGFIRAQETNASVLGSGEEIPMWSYSAVEYLMGLDMAGWRVLELGSGASTVFFSKRVQSVKAIETNAEWAGRLRAMALAGTEIIDSAPEAIPEAMRALEGTFDLISIDPSANRYACARAATQLLKPGGLIVLDNSEWYPNTSEYLRSSDLIEVDFHDFRPQHHYRTTTSFYLSSGFRPVPRQGHLPLVPIGGKSVDNNNWDQRI